MRTVHDSEWSLLDRAIVQWQPGGKGLLVSGHSGVILMSRSDCAREIRENEAACGFWMDQKMRAYEQLHNLLQHGMMRQPMKGWQREDLIVDGFKSGVIFAASRVAICDSIERIGLRSQPPGLMQDGRNVSQERIQVFGRKQTSDQHVTMGVHRCS